MRAYQLSLNFNHKYQHCVKDKIGEGADGDCYSLSNDSDKVVKFSVHYCWDQEDTAKIIDNRLQGYIQVQNNPDLFARLYEFGFLGKGTRQVVSGEQEYLIFYCLMEKLDKISEDEIKVFHTLLSHEDRNCNKRYSLLQISKILKGLAVGLTFDQEEVIFFMQKIMSTKTGYTDFHPRNIMKDKNKNFKLIDFDRIAM